ncbi:N-acetylmuramoyl-L-alanine amidase [Candidatus Halocynthiibacter alkanivorans]|uniref:N-acetylmuramoyl-L-alanine amidase n=1 Tax=Candidatus Halocynthiibacter alkanivorans TaxID=2267619 RepID=UPI000DF2E42C|nr:N-acetylmuramoyl-L-alanine amidase [Candidatus Halocynthiibacter alkanivorans]
MVVLHYTAMDTTEEALQRLCAAEHEVSAHYLISELGQVFQLVADEKRAWHAGAGAWGQVTDVNSHSIGIELANSGRQPFAEPQMAALEQLLQALLQRHAIPRERVIGHSDMAPLRKGDPGARFDWARLARQDLSVWPGAGGGLPADAVKFHALATRFGYVFPPSEMCTDPLTAVLSAFRLRFSPWEHGALNLRDMARIADLAHRFPARGLGRAPVCG